MRYRAHLLMLGLSWITLASCAEEVLEPNAGKIPATPELAVAANSWLTSRDMPYERWELAAAMVKNPAGQSTVYAIGGRTAAGYSLTRVQAYNVVTNSWSWKAPLPIWLHRTNGAGVINGKIYVSGGEQSDRSGKEDPWSNRLYMYDPATNRWAEKARMPESGFQGVTGVMKGQLYVVSTCVWNPPESEWFDTCDPSKFFRYNPVSDRWTVLPRPRNSHTAGAVIDEKFYVTNGTNVERYDPVTNAWTTRASVPITQRRGNAAAAAINHKLFLIGGASSWNEGTPRVVRTVSAYDPATNSWTAKAPLPTPRYDIAATQVWLYGQPRLQVVGGSLPGNNVQYVP